MVNVKDRAILKTLVEQLRRWRQVSFFSILSLLFSGDAVWDWVFIPQQCFANSVKRQTVEFL
jgi:hypothetical protein